MDPRIQLIIRIMEDEPQQKLSLLTMARLAGLSSSRLRHKFKLEVGTTPSVYLRNVKMRKAAELLRSNKFTVKEVRAAIGLKSDSYFTHECKRTYGIAPSRIRTPER